MLLGELAGHTNIIMAAAVRPDGARLATASWDHTVMVWSLARAQELRPIVTARDGVLPQVAFDSDGGRLAVARADGSLSVVDVRTGVVACTAAGATAITKLAWTTGGEIAVVRSGGRAVELRDPRRCAAGPLLEHAEPISAMSTHAGPRLATAAGGVVRVWSRGRLEASFTGYPGGIQSVGVDGDDVYAATSSPAAIVVDTIGAPARRRISRGPKAVLDVRFDRQRGQVVAAGLDQFAYIWDAATGLLVRKLEGAGPLWAVRTSPDGAITIGVGSVSPTVWDRASGQRLGQLEGHSDLVRDGEFIDDRIFISLAWNHTALVWDVVTKRPLMAFRDVDAMVVAPDRRSVALVGAKGVRVWSPRSPSPDLDVLRALPSK
jgi:WD40 repeat protein